MLRPHLFAPAIIVAGLLSAHCTSSGADPEVTANPELIGGTVAKVGQYPASIQINRGTDDNGKPFLTCTGMPISRTHILLAAHCLFKSVDGVQQAFGLTMFYSYGVNGEKLVRTGIKATYLPKEAVQYLTANQVWGAGDVESAHDVAVIELEDQVPAAVAIGTMSSRDVPVGTAFRFGGYGCERHVSTPAEEDVTANASDSSRLKYAQGKVTEVSPLIAQGLTYQGLAKQSLCPGDSGGPVYFDHSPSDPDAVLTEFIGINNFHRSRTSGDDVNSEINFSVLTTRSELGRWVNAVLAGTIEPFGEQ
jgi:secreted trypsin-like serine protease